MNYKGNIFTKLHEVFKKQDGLSVGGKLFSIERELGASFLYADDQSVYEAIEGYLKHPVDSYDEPMEDSEFDEWVASKFKE